MTPPSNPTMFAVRIDPNVYPAIDSPATRDHVRRCIQTMVSRGSVTFRREHSVFDIWRFRGPLPKAAWSDLVFREQWLRQITSQVREILETAAWTKAQADRRVQVETST